MSLREVSMSSGEVEVSMSEKWWDLLLLKKSG